ncbi:MAG: YitT family protein [Bacteroidetes bacterium]|nr:YitT family protein [Bacteroidota bacterium]
MRKFWRKIVIESIRKDRKNGSDKRTFTAFEIARGFRNLRITITTSFKNFFLAVLGITCAAFGLKSFLLPNNFLDGGAMGIAILTTELSDISLSILIILINFPFIILGYNVLGKQFTVKTAIVIGGLSLVLALFSFPQITSDKLLVSVFGGFFLGAGIGFTVRSGAVLDGTEILAIFMSRKFGTSIGDIIFAINLLVFSSAAYFFSIETALYSIITYLSASKTVDFIIEGIEEYMGITIISRHFEEVRSMITDNLGRGVTVYSGKRGYGKTGELKDIDIIYTVITRLEISKLYSEIQKIDPNAFIVKSSVRDTKGGMVKKRPFNH